LLAFRQALSEHEAESGEAGRRALRGELCGAEERDVGAGLSDVHVAGRSGKGYLRIPAVNSASNSLLLTAQVNRQGCIISTFLFPDDNNFDFP